MIHCERHTPSSALADQLVPLAHDSLLASDSFLQLFTHLAGHPVWWIATENDQLLAALPGVEFGNRWFRRFQSLPDGLYSRLCLAPESKERAEELSHGLLQAILAYGYTKAYIYDYYFDFPSLPQWRHRDLITQHVEIPSPDWMPPNRQLRTEIRKADREGIEVHNFDSSRHMDGFMDLVDGTARRNRTAPRYPRQFFAALASLAETDDRILWRWCQHDSKPVASHIVLIESPMALAWQIFFDKQFASLKPNQFMLHQSATILAERGISVLNLGGSPAGVETVVSFKEKWGSEQYRYPMYYHRQGLGRVL
ncbi:GNAT family N-acetyltransferase [candidate division GN15 bacterium]|nr:GNAT family N-acetyltransferase [candidate division GN15 bacterium]